MIDDLPLFAHARALARRSDHDSSHQAARAALRSGLVASHEARILAVLRDSGCATRLDQLAAWTGLSTVQCGRRLSTLVRRGKVRRIALAGERLRWMITARARG